MSWADRPPEAWDAVTGQLRYVLAAEPRATVSARADGRELVALRGREARFFDAETGAPVRAPLTCEPGGACPALSPDGARLALCFGDFSAAIFDLTTGRRTVGPLRHLANMRHVVFTPDGRLLASSGDDQTLRLWDAATGEPVGAPLRHTSYVLHAAVRADGRAFVTASSDGVARLWEIPPAPESPAEMARIARRLNGRGK